MTLTAKISICPDTIWNRFEFRKFLISLNEDNWLGEINPQNQLTKEFFIITELSNTLYNDQAIIKDLVAQLSIPVGNIYYVTDQASKITQITALGVQFHFDGSSRDVDALNLSLFTVIPKFTAFFVNFINNQNTQMMKYIEKFRFELNYFLNGQKFNKAG